MARLIFSFHFGTWKGGERRGESKRKDQPHILTLLFRGEVGSPRTAEGEGALTPWLSNPGQALGCSLAECAATQLYGSAGVRVGNGALPWLLCRLGLLGDTLQPAWVVCIFTAKGLLTRCSHRYLSYWIPEHPQVTPGPSSSIWSLQPTSHFLIMKRALLGLWCLWEL